MIVRRTSVLVFVVGTSLWGCASEVSRSEVEAPEAARSEGRAESVTDGGTSSVHPDAGGEEGGESGAETAADGGLDSAPDAGLDSGGEERRYFACRVEASFTGCYVEEDRQTCEEHLARTNGRGRDRADAERASLERCRARLVDVWRSGPWPIIQLEQPCRVRECGLVVYGGRPPQATVRLAPLQQVSGPGVLNISEARAELARSVGGLVSCYEPRLEVEPMASGEVRVEATVGADGQMSEVGAECPEVLGDELCRCLENHLDAVRFREPGGEVRVRLEVFFRPVVF